MRIYRVQYSTCPLLTLSLSWSVPSPPISDRPSAASLLCPSELQQWGCWAGWLPHIMRSVGPPE